MARAKVTGPAVYVVVRRAWEADEHGCDHMEDNGGMPVAAFPTREAARAFARAAEREARRLAPPAQFAYDFDPDELARKGEESVLRGLKKLGIDPPKDGKWDRWWDRLAPTLTDEQADAVWDLFDLIEFYEVVQAPIEG